MSDKNINSVYNIFKMVGNAILQINGNNTNSGNLSLKDPEDPDRFYITASGSQLGALIPRDIVPVRFNEVSWGDGRASTESNIHRKVLSLPGVNACVHSHHIISTVLTFDTVERQLFLKPAGADSSESGDLVFQPVDMHGASLLGKVKTGYYKQPVGSLEMEERIPRYLAEGVMTLVRGHGPFARGVSLEDCLRSLGIFENSAVLALTLVRRGVELGPIQNKLIEKGPDSIFATYPDENIIVSKENNITDFSTIEDFAHWLSYFYSTRIGAYNTGSMSRKVTAKEMLYCPSSSVPMGMEFPLSRISTKINDDDLFEIMLHKLIYNNTNFTSCIISSNPLITADGMAVLASRYGIGVLTGELTNIPYTREKHPVIVPIDAEAIYLNPRLGLVDISCINNRSPENPILNMLRWHKGCCVVAGFGVISVGDTTLEQAAHNASSAERIGEFRTEVYINEKLLNGPALESFEPKTI
jgi:ribulose-5-phosphate 4-epimerase/fuculose-1-phosphate aldolase